VNVASAQRADRLERRGPSADLRAHVARQLPGYGWCDLHECWTTLPCAHCAALKRVRTAMPVAPGRDYAADPRPSDTSPRGV
jgi:hypothetical protein